MDELKKDFGSGAAGKYDTNSAPFKRVSFFQKNDCTESICCQRYHLRTFLSGCSASSARPKLAREGRSAPSMISVTLAIATGRNATAGTCKRPHRAPPIKGPMKATP